MVWCEDHFEMKKARNRTSMDIFLRKIQNHASMNAHFQRVSVFNIDVKGACRSHTCPVHVGKLREGE